MLCKNMDGRRDIPDVVSVCGGVEQAVKQPVRMNLHRIQTIEMKGPGYLVSNLNSPCTFCVTLGELHCLSLSFVISKMRMVRVHVKV